jgi:catechol 2,3-dioxygenase-like lactoylglutathione lyase family enzyme
MIVGMHTILYSKNADAVRAFFRDVLEFPSVDAGHGWLIFAAPPLELAVHAVEGPGYAELYLMCTDLESTINGLQKKGVQPLPISSQRWGRLTHIRLPDGQTLGLYEPSHPTAIRRESLVTSAENKQGAKPKPPKSPKKSQRRRKS